MSERPLVVLDVAPDEKVALTRLLEGFCSVVCAHHVDELSAMVAREAVDVVVTDLALRGDEILDLASQLRVQPTSPRLIVLCDVDSLPLARRELGKTADDFVVRECASELCGSIVRLLGRDTIPMGIRVTVESSGDAFVWGNSPQMREIRDLVRRLAPLSMPLLLTGETGTGKDVVARFIHAQSSRSSGPFVPVNLAAIPPDLMESSLFGHERGAFTGAVASHRGKMAEAHGGSLFLDEIGDMRFDLQSKLLRAVEEKQCEPVGGHKPVPSDLRLISATNADLAKAVARGKFRADLFYRINVVTLRIPPLRERVEDIPMLFTNFVRRYGEEFHRPVREIAPGVMDLICSYQWPGNVRELQNRVQRAVALCKGSVLRPNDVLDPGDLDPEDFVQEHASAGLCTLEAMEEAYVREVLRRTGDHQAEAARILGVDPKTLYNRMQKYGLTQRRSDRRGVTRARSAGKG